MGKVYTYTTGNLYNWSVNNILAIPNIDHSALCVSCLLSCYFIVVALNFFFLSQLLSNRCNNYVSAWCLNSFNEHAFIVTLMPNILLPVRTDTLIFIDSSIWIYFWGAFFSHFFLLSFVRYSRSLSLSILVLHNLPCHNYFGNSLLKVTACTLLFHFASPLTWLSSYVFVVLHLCACVFSFVVSSLRYI